jgi:hypothetical protein
LDLADHLPKTVQLDGYDISDSQYPSQAVLAENVSLGLLDAFGDVPPHLAGTYDVVHLRFWCAIVKGDDPSPLIRHAMKLLSIIPFPNWLEIYIPNKCLLKSKEPGGYIQWEDAQVGRNFTKGTAAEECGRVSQEIFKASNIIFEYVKKR